MREFAENYYTNLFGFINSIKVTDQKGEMFTFSIGIEKVCNLISSQVNFGKKVIFIGNGGSAAISSHMAIDFWKTGGIKTISFNDGAMLTCIGNDYGYKHVFEKPIEMFADTGDVLVAISSSGRSENILLGVKAARIRGCKIVTLSGFDENNPLSFSGEFNFHVPSKMYGPVEIIHHSICHCIIDTIMKGRKEMDEYRIDSHKLLYHVTRVNDWLNGRLIYPIYMEISPAGSCNHRCIFCALDFMGYQKRCLDTAVLEDTLSEAGRLGLKSVMYGGEGEPLMHDQIAHIISHTRKCNIDVALTTNAVFLKKSLAEKILGDLKWIKVSIGAATRDAYRKIHRANPDDFDDVIRNLLYAVNIKLANRYKCTLGMQILLLPENKDEVVMLAKLARDMGMDYLVVKPYSQHPLSNTLRYKSLQYKEYLYLSDELSSLNTKNFSVIFRINTMKKWDENVREYSRCFALPFWSYMDAGGHVWGCSAYLGDERFLYGSIYKNSFKEIWEGKKRVDSLGWVENELDSSQCRVNCRMDEINCYLWRLRNPVEHVNFI